MELHALVLEGANPWYETAAEVLRLSIEAKSPSTKITIHRQGICEKISAARADAHRPVATMVSAHKMKWQNEIIQESENGALVGFLDSDMLCLRDLSIASSLIEDCDLIITSAVAGNKYKWNTGFVLCSVSERTKRFYDEWRLQAKGMMMNRGFHNQYHATYGGVSQSSLAHVLQSTDVGCKTKVAPVPTSEWNALNVTHRQPGAEPRLVHIVGALRNRIRSSMQPVSRPDRTVDKYCQIWRAYEGMIKR